MIGQVQVTRYGDPTIAAEKIRAHKEQILALANSFHPSMQRRGGGARDVEVRLLPAPEGSRGEPLLVVHLIIDTQEAMGANLINTMAEGVAPLIEQITGGHVYLRILCNLADRRLARASCQIPLDALADFDMSGPEIAEGISQASRFARADPYRAATHNKGIMNGIDAVAIATGQDWRAIEAGAHAFACRDGQYRPLSQWYVEDGHLVGRIELPLALGHRGWADQDPPRRAAGAEAHRHPRRPRDEHGVRRGGPGAELRRAPRARLGGHPEGPHGAARPLRGGDRRRPRGPRGEGGPPAGQERNRQGRQGQRRSSPRSGLPTRTGRPSGREPEVERRPPRGGAGAGPGRSPEPGGVRPGEGHPARRARGGVRPSGARGPPHPRRHRARHARPSDAA